MRLIILFGLALWLPLAVQAQNALTYTTNNGAITISGFVGSSSSVTNVVIPGAINGYPVVNLGVDAFYSCSKLTNVVVPASVTNLSDKAFDTCTKLTNIIFLGSAPALGANVFLSDSANLTIYAGNTNGWGSVYDGFRVSPLLVGLTNDAITIVGCNTNNANFANYGGKMTIPAAVGAYPVENIGFEAFAFCTNLTSVVIPTNVWNISDDAFGDCSGLTNVIFPAGLTTIGFDAFIECASLPRLSIPSGVTSLGAQAFANCTSLTNITFLGNAPSLGVYEFNGDTATVYYYYGTSGWGATYGGLPAVELGVPFTFTTNNGAITITGYLGSGGALTIPATINNDPVVSIGDGTFTNNASLTSVIIPSSVTNIGGGVFGGCTSLTNVVISGNLTSIGVGTFAHCSSLTSLAIPTNVTSIGVDAFDDCSSLTSLTIPAGVTSIGGGAFMLCTSLTNVTFLSNAPALTGNTVFQGDLIATIYYNCNTTGWGATYGGEPTVGTGVVGDYAVMIAGGGVTITGYSGSSAAVTIPANINGFPVMSIGGYAFYECFGLTSINIPNSVTTIGGSAFWSCFALTNVVIPASVTNIEVAAFYNCAALTSVTFMGNAPASGGSLFGNDPNMGGVYYYYGTSGWGTTFDYSPSVPTVKLGSTPQIVGGASAQGTKFGFTINAVANQTVTVEASTNLVNWQPIWTNTLSAASTNFVDPQWQNFPGRYYRVR